MPLKLVLSGTNTLDLFTHEKSVLIKLPPGVEKGELNLVKETLSQVQEKLGSTGLFAQPRLWRVVKWESLKSPKQKAEVVQLLQNLPDEVMILIPQEMTPAQKKLFDPKLWQLKEFKLPKVFFQLTESIKTKPLKDVMSLFERSLEQKNEWELHALLARQFRLLLATKTGAPVLAPPFAKATLETQAKKFTPEQLVLALQELFRIELEQKTGKAHLTWSQEFDRLLVKLYDNRVL